MSKQRKHFLHALWTLSFPFASGRQAASKKRAGGRQTESVESMSTISRTTPPLHIPAQVCSPPFTGYASSNEVTTLAYAPRLRIVQ